MKITRRPINASAEITIPAPFDEYYMIMPDKDYENLTGTPSHPSPCEEANYGMKHIYYLTAKPEYRAELDDIGLRDVELVRDLNNIRVCYNVKDRVFYVDHRDLPGYTVDDELEEAFGDSPIDGIATMFGISYESAELIYDWYFNNGIAQKYDSIRDLLNYINDDIYDMLDAYGDEDLKEEVLENIKGATDVSAAVDTGLEYWYYSRHGMGPGTIPRGVTVLDWYEEGYKTWMLLDKMLTTTELNDHELKEQTPPEGVTTHNGTVIESCSDIRAAEATKISETDDTIEYVIASKDDEDGRPDSEFVIDYPIPNRLLKDEQKRWAQMELDDEADAYDREHKEGKYQDIEGSSVLDRISLDRLKADLEEACEDYMIHLGYLPRSAPKDKYIEYADDQYTVAIRRGDFYNGDCIECKVLAELDYDEQTDLIYNFLNPVIKNYDKDAYFEHDTTGVVVGIIWESDRLVASEQVEAASDDAAIDKLRETMYIDPDYGMGSEEEDTLPDDIVIDIPVAVTVTVNEDTSWSLDDESFLGDYVEGDNVPEDALIEDFEFIFSWAVPAAPGKYFIRGKVVLTYEADTTFEGDVVYILVPRKSSAVPQEISPAGKIEESTQVSEGEPINAAEIIDGPIQDLDVVIRCKLIVDDKSIDGWTIDNTSYTEAWKPYEDQVANLGLDIDEVMEDLGFAIATYVPYEPGTYDMEITAHLSYINNRYDPKHTHIDVKVAPEGEPLPELDSDAAMMTEAELDDALLAGRPFDLASFKKYKVNVGKDVLTADKLDVGDIVSITESAEEVNLGTVVKILAINDPAEDWIDYTFRVEIVSQPKETQLADGSIMDLHFDSDEPVGSLVLN